MRTILIVGASLGGMTVAQGLREAGVTDAITLIGAEASLPYDRPPLSKSVLADPAVAVLDDYHLKPPQWFEANDVQLLPGRVAHTLDPVAMIVGAGRQTFRGDEIVLATGSRPRSLPGLTSMTGVYTLRTWTDAQRLGQRLQHPGHVLIIGAGFIGLETAAVARALGWQVTLVERDSAPLARVLPVEFAQVCWAPYAAASVSLRTGVTVDSVEESTSGLRCQFSDSTSLTADIAILAVGSEPNVEWLAGSGLAVDGGIVCDAIGRTSAPGIWAVGDASRWYNAWLGRSDRVEQWQATRSQGDIVARAIAGVTPAAWAEPPYFWSDLTGGRVQFLGDCAPGREVSVLTSGQRVIGLLSAGGQLRGIFARQAARAIAGGRDLLIRDTPLSEAEAWAATLLDVHPPTRTCVNERQ